MNPSSSPWIAPPGPRKRRTKILCTLGPSTEGGGMLRALIEAGMDVARFNFSHGTHGQHRAVFQTLQREAAALGRVVGTLQDLSGPKIRVGSVRPDTTLEPGQALTLTPEPVEGDRERVHVSYPRLAQEVDPGDRILLDDGLLELEVVEPRSTGEVLTRVLVGGVLSSRKGVNLPGSRLSVPSLTEKDVVDLRFGLELGIDLIALSFVRAPEDVLRVRQVMDEVGIHRPVIAKLEKPEAVARLEEVVQSFDGVMVARGDLGIEVPLESVPMIQKRTIALGLKLGRPVITATQMLDSMIRNPRPTRAEVNDIANAILDGTDAVMLSGETASGRYPLEAVEVMSRVAAEAEDALPYGSIHTASATSSCPTEAVALAACEIAEVVGARAIVAFTTSGRTAAAVARYRPRAPILGLAHDPAVARQMSLIWGVVPCCVPAFVDTDGLLKAAHRAARESTYVQPGERFVVVAGVPVGSPTSLVHLATLE